MLGLTLSVAAHLALFAAIQMQPAPGSPVKLTYDYLSSAVWEVFGPTRAVKIIEVYWPGFADGEKPDCQDVEQALDGLDFRRADEGWCSSRALASRGAESF